MAEKEQVIARLRRIEGQVRGLTRMVQEDQECDQILTQLLAVRAALDQAGLKIIARYMEDCLPDQMMEQDIPQARQHMQRILELVVRMR